MRNKRRLFLRRAAGFLSPLRGAALPPGRAGSGRGEAGFLGSWWNKMRRPGIFKTRGLVISGYELKWPDPGSDHCQLGCNYLAPVTWSLD